MLKLYKIVIFGQVTNKNVAKFEDLYLYEKNSINTIDYFGYLYWNFP